MFNNSIATFICSTLKMTSLWQITNGRNFAQLIWSGENLIDCEFLKDGGSVVDEFVDNFAQEYNLIQNARNSDFGSARHHKYQESSNENMSNIKSNVTFINLMRLQDIPERFLDLMNLKNLRKKCNQLHRSIKQTLQIEGDTENDFESENTNGR